MLKSNDDTFAIAFTEYQNRVEQLQLSIEEHLLDSGIENAEKFHKLVVNEQKFLNRLASQRDNGEVSRLINCGNLVYFESLYSLSQTLPDVVAVYKDFKYSIEPQIPGNPRQSSIKRSIRVDIVYDNGLKWMRVKASKKGMKDDNDNESTSSSESDDPTTSMQMLTKSFRIANDLVLASKQNLVHYQQPECIFYFMYRDNVTDKTIRRLMSIGCKVAFDHDDHAEIAYNDPFKCSSIVNLDISSLFALTSHLCHSPLGLKFTKARQLNALLQQSKSESENSVLSSFREIFKNADRIIVCESCYERFQQIIKTLGGPGEQLRAEKLFNEGLLAIFPDYPKLHHKRMEIVPDNPSERFVQLKSLLDTRGGDEPLTHAKAAAVPKFTEHNLAIFGTGDRYKATTLTANKWVGNALKHLDNSEQFCQNFADVSIWCHPSRSLCERFLLE